MTKKRTLTTEPEYHGYPINTGTNNNLACDTHILDTIERVVERSLEKHSRVLATRFDIRFPDGFSPNDNEELKEIMKQTVTATKRHAGTKPDYVLVREQSEDGGHHYNGIMLLDHSIKKSPIKVLQEMERIADHVCGVEGRNGTDNQGLVHLCEDSMIVHRDNDEEREQALYRASYLAKLKDKGDSGREVFCSKTR